ncbi:MAG: thiamine pyrophosphate-dependent dehydrogenase E1 component subunit alpha [Candidatus Eisenbacteria bacterium]|nr:thiamine pyrophosphate-dependent dehydrogenase E1 component subunit alpha [Candidatus Eisenbacteria bacterium]
MSSTTVSAGKADPGAVSRDVALQLFRVMKLTRETDDRLERKLYRQGKIVGGCYVGRGQEAIPIGCVIALEPDDVIFPTHRELGAFIARGMSLTTLFAQYLGRADTPTRGKDGNAHIGDMSLGLINYVSHLADSVPIAAGAAWAFKARGEKRVALNFLGEGSTSRGDFYEGVNFAAIHKLPAIYVVNNNQWAYSTPTHLQMPVANVADRAPAFNIPGVIVDGNDVEAVYLAALEACARARRGDGPTLIECKTFRMTGHSAHDDAGYVPKEQFELWARKDPIQRMERRLRERGWVDDAAIAAMDAEMKKSVEAAAETALAMAYPDGSETLERVFAEPHRVKDVFPWRHTDEYKAIEIKKEKP